MERNNKNVLKYFSGIMTDTEKAEFEMALKSNKELLARFNKIKDQVNNLNISEKEIEFDERYFNSILPKVRSRIDKKTLFFIQPKFVYSFSSLVAAAILLIVFIPTSSNVEFSFNNYKNEIESIISEDGAGDAIDDIFNDSYSYPLTENSFNQVSEKLNEDLVYELTDNYSINGDINILHYTEPYEFIEDLDEKELNRILNELSEIKIL